MAILLYADDLVLSGESVEEVLGNYEKWKESLKKKSVRITVEETKDMQLLHGKRRVTANIDPCGICEERIGCNSNKCLQCKTWVHRRRSNVSRGVSLTAVLDAFVCRSCRALVPVEVENPVSECCNNQPEMVS